MAPRRYSIIIPVFNRPDEIDELLESLTCQTFKRFEVIVVEDGSQIRCDKIVEKYIHELDLTYCFKENEGQGFARNHGYKKARGDYMIVFDSDCILPPDYLKTVDTHLELEYLDAYGGPDKAHENFSPIQKAINYSMTSFLTTGGIRNRKTAIGGFSPKSFNMGISREVFEATGGYKIPYKGEDIEFSTRIRKMGFKTGLIEEAFVYHKRRTSWKQFFRQLHFFGKARINIASFFPEQLKFVHLFPAFFTLGLFLILILWPIFPEIALATAVIYLSYFLVLFFDAIRKSQNFYIAILSLWAAFLQLTAYGLGLVQEFLIRIFKKGQKRTIL